MPRFSVIIPVFSQPELLEQCLRRVRTSTFSDYELLVSDDCSPDAGAIQSVADQHGARMVRSNARKGSAAARNSAALIASGEILVFLDADVTVSEETLARFAQAFDQDPCLDAVIGSYDRQPSATGKVSQFRNLLHAHIHQTSRREASTFWTGCGAVQREKFLAMGGFDEDFTRPSIEDVEFGLRLHRADGRILLEPAIQVTHHKSWDLFSMVRTDLLARAIPWAALIREHGLPRDLNFRLRDRFGVALTALAVPLAVIAVRHGGMYWGLLTVALAMTAFLQASLLRFLAASKGVLFAATCFPLLLVYNLTCVLGLVAGLFRAESRRDRWLVPSLLGCAALILGLQIAGGAYRAEFDAGPDEAAHFVSGLMVYDYLAAVPRENPIAWAERYYLHYPKVAIGHWPPGFPLMEAAWWLVFPPSRTSSMWLNTAMMLLIAAVFYHLLRTVAPAWLALCADLLLIAAPVVQQSYSESMADLPCLLWSVLLTDAMVRLLRRPSFTSGGLVGLWLICALLTKGTAACLAPAPVLALLITGQWRVLKTWWILLVAAAVLSLGFGWYLLEDAILHENFRSLSGVAVNFPWEVGLIPGLTGYGFCILACGGVLAALVYRRPAAVSAAAILLSTVVGSWFVRAMNEPRHFIVLVPAILLLSVEVLVWAGTRARFAFALGIPALALFPFTLFLQSPAGFAGLLHQVHLPGRMMVSSNGAGEGAWIAEVALAEKRPASVIARASKTLAAGGWNDENYRLITRTPDEIEARLDEVAIDTVIVITEPASKIAQHQLLLERMLRNSAKWRPCAAAGAATVYCRTAPPSVVRQPLRIDLTDKLGRFIQEP
jgi:GT2 family glycosyltransferase